MNLTLKSDISLHLTSPLLSSVLQIYLLLPLPKPDSRDRRDGSPSLSFIAFPDEASGGRDSLCRCLHGGTHTNSSL